MDVSLARGVFAGDIQVAVTHLLQSGRICSTIDDNHFCAANRQSLSGAVLKFIKDGEFLIRLSLFTFI